jgi:hypothetical protein
MRAIDGRIIPSSDRLLHEFLRGASWESVSRNELTLFKRRDSKLASYANEASPAVSEIAPGSKLLTIDRAPDVIAAGESFVVATAWDFKQDREVFPWMLLRLVRADGRVTKTWNLGLCAPEARDGVYEQRWEVTGTASLTRGEYRLQAIFLDAAKNRWSPAEETAPSQITLLALPIDLGTVSVR